MAVMRGIRPYGLRLPKLFPGASVRQLLQGLLRERTCAAGCCSPGQKTVRRAVGRSPGRRDSVHEGGERDSVQKPPPTDRPATFELHGSARFVDVGEEFAEQKKWAVGAFAGMADTSQVSLFG